MNKSITQTASDDKQITETIRDFFLKYHIGSTLKAANAYKSKGIPVVHVFRYLFLLVFSNRSMYMDILTGKSKAPFGKDTVYRFLQSTSINWVRFTTLLSSGIIRKSIDPLTSENRVDVLIIDDSVYERNRSKKVELLTKVWDHAHNIYLWGFRMLTLGWSDGNTFLPVSSVLMSSEHPEKRRNENNALDKRSAGYRQRCLSMKKATETMLVLLKAAKKAAIPAKYVLFDSWFSSPQSLHAVKNIGYDVIAMTKKSQKMKFLYNRRKQSLKDIYKANRKRRGRSKYLLSVLVEVEKDGAVMPAKVVYVRNRSNRKEYLCIISTDISIDEEEIIRIYGKRWQIEVFFKVCKSYLRLSKECRSLSYDAITAHTAVVFTRYMMLSVENRAAGDFRTLGELFFFLSDELSDITWIEAFHQLMELFKHLLADTFEVSEEMISEYVEAFMNVLPSAIQKQLIAA